MGGSPFETQIVSSTSACKGWRDWSVLACIRCSLTASRRLPNLFLTRLPRNSRFTLQNVPDVIDFQSGFSTRFPTMLVDGLATCLATGEAG
jgi:hypothetical protein